MYLSILKELNRTKVAKEETTDAGGWCPIASKTKHLGFDASLATALASFFEGIKINEIDLANKKHKAIKCEQTKHTCKTFYHKGTCKTGLISFIPVLFTVKSVNKGYPREMHGLYRHVVFNNRLLC